MIWRPHAVGVRVELRRFNAQAGGPTARRDHFWRSSVLGRRVRWGARHTQATTPAGLQPADRQHLQCGGPGKKAGRQQRGCGPRPSPDHTRSEQGDPNPSKNGSASSGWNPGLGRVADGHDAQRSHWGPAPFPFHCDALSTNCISAAKSAPVAGAASVRLRILAGSSE